MSTSATVSEVLKGYVSRGLLRNFSERGKGDFRFFWLNYEPMQLQWKSARHALVFKDVLPNVPARSALYREVRAFLKERAKTDLPDHRRVDPAEFELMCLNRQSRVSVGLRLVAGTEETAMQKMMLIIHELFLMLNDRWPDYMHQEFETSLE